MKYIPKNIEQRITDVLYTSGKEFMYEDGVEYIGFYFTNGDRVMSGKTKTDQSKKLLKYNPSEDYLSYIKIKGFFLHNYKTPKEYYPKITEKDYERGILDRYFIKKKNDIYSRIIEIDEKQWKSLAVKNSGLDENLYLDVRINWKISGPTHDIVKNGLIVEYGIVDTNRRTLNVSEKDFFGITQFLNNLQQFSKITIPSGPSRSTIVTGITSSSTLQQNSSELS